MRLPEWIKVKSFTGLHNTKSILRNYGLSTVCEEAKCPNRGECFSKPTATFMILGSACTRNCGFCAVGISKSKSLNDESNPPLPPFTKGGMGGFSDEPEKVAMAAKEMGLKYVVITSVTRDDIKDGGASHFAKTVSAVRKHLPAAKVEVLTPDFRGNKDSLKTVLDSRPDVYNHNVETVPRLYPYVRHQADYRRSLDVLLNAKNIAPDITIKSGFMVGLGETFNEIIHVLKDLRDAGCDTVTIGQYLRPSKKNLPVREYVRPEMFDVYKEIALDLGFKYAASSPLARSSMNAEEMYNNSVSI
ncbi:MAG: lipoyl synthase [Thermodesulfovibrionales bacterium]|nr:lipoyl synthase [Thermodesulfovibrionales bacterium]MDP3112750.1 lipoyl synthase [Thermodesulfovibrionales bacterium]